MIDKRKIVLERRDYEEYTSLLRDFEKKEVHPETVYAEIVSPLVFPNFEELIAHFLETPNARGLFFPIGNSKWVKKTVQEVREDGDNLINRIIARKCACLSFNLEKEDIIEGRKILNEIVFSRFFGKVVSNDLYAPGMARYEYEWNGDCPWSPQIKASYKRNIVENLRINFN